MDELLYWRNILDSLLLNYHPSRSFEWSFNQSTKEVLAYIKEQNPDKEKIWLAVHWLYLRPFYFYTEKRNYYHHIKLPAWTQELPTHHNFQYFYVRGKEDAAKLGEQYVLEKRFDGGLMY